MEEKWIVSLQEVCGGDIRLVGGKGANLGEMIKIGIPAPPGFAVTTKVFDKFLAETGAAQEIKQYLRKYAKEPRSILEFQEVSHAIMGIITSAEVPKVLREVICQAYGGLCQRFGVADVPVAVRSSGVTEDMPTASFAGQYDSYLNVRGKEDLISKMRLCWASAFNERCISYRVRKKLGVLAGSVSVVVQKMVNARSAGVGFTIDPDTGDEIRIILEGNWGLGESVVQGTVNPDVFVINKGTLILEEKIIGLKLRQSSIRERGTEEEDVPLEKQSLSCLNDREAIKIGEYAKLMELHYGFPIDVEWVVARDMRFPENIYMTQVRPTTAVVEKKSPTEKIMDMLVSRVHRR